MSSTARDLSKASDPGAGVTFETEVQLAARDRIRLRLVVAEGEIREAKLSGIGCPEMLALITEWRPKLTGKLSDLPLPAGGGHAAILLRELLLRAQGKWAFPYKDEELCHCRSVPTKKVDDAIIGGLRSVDAISRATSAGTSCGTCRPDIEKILNYRLTGK